MATRRMTRARGPSPVPIIILSVLVVGLIGSTVVLAMNLGQLKDERDEARKDARKYDALSKKEAGKLRDYEVLIGWVYDEAAGKFDDFKASLQKLLAQEPGIGQPREVNTFKDMVYEYADLSRERQKALREIQQQLAQAKREREESITDQLATKKAKLKGDREAAQVIAAVRQTKDTLKAKLATVSSDRDAKLDLLKDERSKFGKESARLQKEVKVLQDTIKQKEELIEELKKGPRQKQPPLVATAPGGPVTPSKTEEADGKILTVEPSGDFVTVNIGRRDWVREAMEFRVYEDTNPEDRKEKGRIQVRRVYDTIAHCKVLQQEALDPILRGMVVINPAYSPGKTLEFVFEGKFREPNIQRYVLRYPCRIAKKVSITTDYLIIGGAERRRGEPDPRDTENYRLALSLDVTIMRERDLLRYLGETD